MILKATVVFECGVMWLGVFFAGKGVFGDWDGWFWSGGDGDGGI